MVRPIAATAAVALFATGGVIGAPVESAAAASSSTVRVVRSDVALAASSSILNIPFNLFQAIVNIPYNEVQALNVLSDGMFLGGPWFVASNTNIWGVDPADPPKFEAAAFLLVPFPALSGLGAGEFDWDAGLGQQLAGLAAAELQVNKDCVVGVCLPFTPTSPITGITLIDYFLWGALTIAGQQRFPIINDWFQVPIEELIQGYNFGPITNPAGSAYSWNGLPGTVGPDNLMPWANTTFKLDLAKPFANFLDSLMAEPDISAFKLPTIEEFGRTIQTFAAAAMFWDPFVPGSPFCPGDCKIVTDLHLDYPDLIRYIGAVWPGNTRIDQWLENYENNTANIATPEQIQSSIDVLQPKTIWDFSNPSPPKSWNTQGHDGTELLSFYHQLFTALGLNPDPLYDPGKTSVAGTSGSVSALESGDISLLSAPDAGEQTEDLNDTVGGDLTQDPTKTDANPGDAAGQDVNGIGGPSAERRGERFRGAHLLAKIFKAPGALQDQQKSDAQQGLVDQQKPDDQQTADDHKTADDQKTLGGVKKADAQQTADDQKKVDGQQKTDDKSQQKTDDKSQQKTDDKAQQNDKSQQNDKPGRKHALRDKKAGGGKTDNKADGGKQDHADGGDRGSESAD